MSTFAYVDSLLIAAERLCAAVPSPFAAERPDLAPDEARLLLSFIALTRERLLGALDRLGLPRPQQHLSARFSASTNFSFAGVALSELDAEHLRGYGDVDEEAAAQLTALASDLRDLLERARRMLHDLDAGGLAETLAGLHGPAGEVLRVVDRLSREFALAPVRPMLAAAAERAAGDTFDVGVFGRVSAGKSSLINALVGEALLPVGATPVTAVPVRLAWGERRAVVSFNNGSVRALPVESIADFATEERNPDNRADVRAIDVTTPAIPKGLRLLDTPGVGSLGTSGPALAFQWLPRCDLGLVLVAVGSAVGRDDLALISGLRQAGIRCEILLSKSDLLREDEQEASLHYVQSALARVIAGDSPIPVHAVSTAAGASGSLDALRESVLAPLARDHARASRVALASRLRRLLETTATAIRGQHDGTDDTTVRWQQARVEAQRVVRREADRIDGAASDVLEAAVAAATGAWDHGEDAGSAVRAAVIRAAGEPLGVITESIDAVRSLSMATDMDGRRVPPLFDPAVLDALPELRAC